MKGSKQKPLVCVTGSNGHVGSWIVKELLENNYRVRAVIRNLKQQNRFDFLKAFDSSGDSIEFVEYDFVTLKSGFEKILENCRFLIHTAAPYYLSTTNPEKDLVLPSVRGTLTVLEAAMKVKSIEKVVITGSIASITDSSKKNYVYTELDWNNESSLYRNPYYYAKTQGERAAMQLIKSKKPHYTLIYLNPSMCVGPELNPTAPVNTSNQILLNCINGHYPAVFAGAWALIDVRDVAKIHRIALEHQKMEGRYLVTYKSLWMKVNLISPNIFAK